MAVIKIDGLTRCKSNRMKLTEEAISQQITTLLVKKARGTAANDAGEFLHQLFDVSMAETDHQVETVMKQTGCQVLLLKNKRGPQLELRAWPGVDPNAQDIDIMTNDMPMRFAVLTIWKSVFSNRSSNTKATLSSILEKCEAGTMTESGESEGRSEYFCHR